VCGEAAVWGDGVVPVAAAHLEGSLQLTLDGVYHSPLGAADGAAAGAVPQVAPAPHDSDDYGAAAAAQAAQAAQAAPGPRLWYGSPGVLERWVGVLGGPQAASEVAAAMASGGAAAGGGAAAAAEL
jgi:hypothetical protein